MAPRLLVRRLLIPSRQSTGAPYEEVNDMMTVTQEMLKTRRRILLVESDSDARKTILATLKKVGYAVVEATSSDQAVILLGANEHSDTVSAILCDIRAPKIKGIEAATYF